MTAQELQTRAAARAKAEHVKCFKLVSGDAYAVTSINVAPGSFYLVQSLPDDDYACNCKGFEYRQSCKHVEAVKARIARDAKKAARIARQQHTADADRATAPVVYDRASDPLFMDEPPPKRRHAATYAEWASR